MGMGFSKQPASRPTIYQNLTSPNPTATVCSAKFSNGTQQIRVITSLAGWFSIDQSTSVTGVSSTTVATSSPGGTFIPAATFTGEYFTVTPGQLLTFCTTTAGSSGYVSVTEMA